MNGDAWICEREKLSASASAILDRNEDVEDEEDLRESAGVVDDMLLRFMIVGVSPES